MQQIFSFQIHDCIGFSVETSTLKCSIAVGYPGDFGVLRKPKFKAGTDFYLSLQYQEDHDCNKVKSENNWGKFYPKITLCMCLSVG